MNIKLLSPFCTRMLFESTYRNSIRCVHRLECKGRTGRDRLGGYTKWDQVYELR